MISIRNRAKELLPSVLMTLLSIIQALALEFLWNQIQEADYLWSFGWSSVLGWLQLLAAMLGILQVWVFYTGIAMRFRWAPHMRDLMLPFGVGVLEFTLIDLTGSAYLPFWLGTLAAVFALSVAVAQDIFARVRRDPDNEEYFTAREPATRADLLGPAATVVALLVFAVATYVFDDEHWLALAAIVFAIGTLVFRTLESRRYWNISIGHQTQP